MTKLLQLNCYIPSRMNKTNELLQEIKQNENYCEHNYHCYNQHIYWKKNIVNGVGIEVPWGKHNNVTWRAHSPFKSKFDSYDGLKSTYDKFKVLPIVMIKDPVNWMSSMCRNSYGVQWR